MYTNLYFLVFLLPFIKGSSEERGKITEREGDGGLTTGAETRVSVLRSSRKSAREKQSARVRITLQRSYNTKNHEHNFFT